MRACTSSKHQITKTYPALKLPPQDLMKTYTCARHPIGMGITIACDACGKLLVPGMLHDRDTLLAAIAVRGLAAGGAVAEAPDGGILVACCEACRHILTTQYANGRPALYVSATGATPDEPSKPI